MEYLKWQTRESLETGLGEGASERMTQNHDTYSPYSRWMLALLRYSDRARGKFKMRLGRGTL